MIKIIFTDMDGTLLNSKWTYNKEYFAKIFKEMQNQKIIFVPCSGKQCERIEELFGEYAKDLYIIGDSATRIKHQGKYIYESLIDNKLGLEIIKSFSAKNDVVMVACTGNVAYIKDDINEEDFKVVRHSYANLKKIKSYDEIKEDFIKITVYDAKKRCFTSVKDLDKFKDRVYIVASEDAWIDITNQGVHKGTTAVWLMKHFKIDRSEAMAFGDGYNDIELIEEVDYSFSVANAVDAMKEKTMFVTKSNDEDGVFKTIDMFLRLQGGINE